MSCFWKVKNFVAVWPQNGKIDKWINLLQSETIKYESTRGTNSLIKSIGNPVLF